MLVKGKKGSWKPLNVLITLVGSVLIAALIITMGKGLLFDALAQAGEFLTPEHLWSLVTNA